MFRAFALTLRARLRSATGRNKATELFPPLANVLQLLTVFRRLVKRRFRNFFIRDRDAEPAAEPAQLIFVELFLLMGDIAAFSAFAKTIPFDRAGKNDRGRTSMFDCGSICSMHFHRIMAAELQLLELFV